MKLFSKSKRIIAVFLSICLFSISLTGCEFNSDPNDKFDEFIKAVPQSLISSDDLSMNYLFSNPEDFGFKIELLQLPFSTVEDNDSGKKETEQMIKTLDKFNREELSEENKINLDILRDSLTRTLPLYDDYYISTNYLGSFLGFQAQLPLLLNDFKLERKNDLDSYFNILRTAKDTFLKYSELEKQRQEKGVGMSQTIIDKVIKQCDNFTKENRPFLIDEVNGKIDKLSFLSDEEKATAKKENEKLLTEDFIQAYKALGDDLRTIKASNEDLGLSSQPNGLKYYESLIKYSTGTDFTTDELRSYVADRFNKYLAEFQDFAVKNPKEFEMLQSGDIVFSDFKTVNENIDYLRQKVAADFPPLAQLNYKVTPVPKAMEENFSPAAYLTNTIDALPESVESIYLNGEFDQKLFKTIAHEAYPGHMYQCSYARSLSLPTFRYMVSYGGYSEGWADYVENNTAKYAPKNEVMLRGLELNQLLSNMVIVFYDIGVHADGWSRDDFFEAYSVDFGATREASDYMYDVILETPANYMKYFVGGMQFQDLYEYAKTELGEAFSETEFHKAVLSTAESPFFVVKNQVDKYISEVNKNKTPEAQSEPLLDAA